MNARLVAFLSLFPFAALAQGFAGLGTDAEGFAVPTQGYEFDFPRDHGAHPAFRIEWWYVTANMTGPDGTDYGLQWTLFRNALAPQDGTGWDTPQVWLGHAAVTTPEHHYSTERYARGGIGQAGALDTRLSAWVDDWELTQGTPWHMTARGPDWSYDVTLTETGPVVLQGDGGYSVKSADGQASYYYSMPFLQLTGTLHLPEGDIPVTGQAWLDREWSSQPLSPDQTGWDWFSLSFDDGAKMMGFRLRDTGGGAYTSATWIGPDGTTRAYSDGALTATPDGGNPPTGWALQLPAEGLDVKVQAINPAAQMAVSIPYWEGPVTVTGSHSGRGYLEMTGYAAAEE